MANLRWHARLLYEGARDILEHRGKIQLLLIVTTKCRAGLLARDRKHRHVVHACIVEASK